MHEYDDLLPLDVDQANYPFLVDPWVKSLADLEDAKLAEHAGVGKLCVVNVNTPEYYADLWTAESTPKLDHDWITEHYEYVLVSEFTKK